MQRFAAAPCYSDGQLKPPHPANWYAPGQVYEPLLPGLDKVLAVIPGANPRRLPPKRLVIIPLTDEFVRKLAAGEWG